MIDDPVHFTRLKKMSLSPLHYFATEEEDNISLRQGRAVHSILLGGDPVIYYEKRRYGKEWDVFETEHPGHVILSTSEYEHALRMVEAVRSNEHAMALFGDPAAEHEVTIKWDIAGRQCEGRVDTILGRKLVELKSTKLAKPSFFVGEALRRAYHAQLSFYRNGAHRAGRVLSTDHYIVAAESKTPYPVVVYKVTDRALEAGEKLWRTWWERLMVCEASDYWPGYAENIVELDVPEEDFMFADEVGVEEVA